VTPSGQQDRAHVDLYLLVVGVLASGLGALHRSATRLACTGAAGAGALVVTGILGIASS
jgi:hypothetical protein